GSVRRRPGGESGWQRRADAGGEAPPGTREASVLAETDSADGLEALLSEVIANVRERECEVQDKEGRWYSLRARPYFTLDNKVDGAVLVVVDITDLKRTEAETKTARDHAEAAAARLQHALRELQHFSYTITHALD